MLPEAAPAGAVFKYYQSTSKACIQILEGLIFGTSCQSLHLQALCSVAVRAKHGQVHPPAGMLAAIMAWPHLCSTLTRHVRQSVDSVGFRVDWKPKWTHAIVFATSVGCFWMEMLYRMVSISRNKSNLYQEPSKG